MAIMAKINTVNGVGEAISPLATAIVHDRIVKLVIVFGQSKLNVSTN